MFESIQTAKNKAEKQA